MSDRRIRAKELLQTAKDAGPVQVKVPNLSFEDFHILNELIDRGYVTGTIFPPNNEAVVRLTVSGQEYLDQLTADQKSWWRRVEGWVRSNLFKIVGGIAFAWLVFLFGPELGILEFFSQAKFPAPN